MRRLAYAVALIALACSSLGALAGPDQKPETRIVFIVHPGPANPPGKSLLDNPQIRDHGAFMVKLFQSGKVVRGGPFTDGSGGIGMATKDVSLDEMTKLAAEDPAAKSGVITYEIKTWMLGVGEP